MIIPFQKLPEQLYAYIVAYLENFWWREAKGCDKIEAFT